MPEHLNGIPYAVATDEVTNWPNTSKELAQWLDRNRTNVSAELLAELRALVARAQALTGADNIPNSPIGRLFALETSVNYINKVDLVTMKRSITKLEAANADTGWVNIPAASGFEWRKGYEGQARKWGPIVQYRGQMPMTVGDWSKGSDKATVPSELSPSGQEVQTPWSISGETLISWVRTNGTLYVGPTTVKTGYFVLNATFFQ